MDDLTPHDLLMQMLLIDGLCVAILAALAAGGVFSARAFDSAPPREGRLTVADLLLTGALWLVGMIATVVFLGLLHHVGEISKPGTELTLMLASQAFMAPSILYILARASAAIEGGIAAFGFGLRRLPRSIGVAIVSLLAVMPVMTAVSMVTTQFAEYLGHKPEMLAHEALPLLTQNLFTPVWWGLVISAVVLAPLVEETLFRGVVQTTLRQGAMIKSRWTVIVVASLLFASIHGGVVPWYGLPSLFLLALGLGYVYEKTGSLFASMVMHGLFNASQIAIAIAVTKPVHP